MSEMSSKISISLRNVGFRTKLFCVSSQDNNTQDAPMNANDGIPVVNPDVETNYLVYSPNTSLGTFPARVEIPFPGKVSLGSWERMLFPETGYGESFARPPLLPAIPE